MTSPYCLDSDLLRTKAKQASEERLITLDQGPVSLPPTIGPDQGTGLLGPFFSQPASRHTTFSHSRPSASWATRVALFVVMAVAVLALIKLFQQ